MHHPQTPLKSLWLVGIMGCALLVGPCVIWLAKNTAHAEFEPNLPLHLTLVAIGWLLLIPLASAIHWGTGFNKPHSEPSALYGMVIHGTMLAAVGVFLLQTWWVLRVCWTFLQMRVQQNQVLLSDLEDPGLNTLRLLTLTVAINAFIAISRVLYCALGDGNSWLMGMGVVLGQLTMVVFLAASFIRQFLAPAPATEAVRSSLFCADIGGDGAGQVLPLVGTGAGLREKGDSGCRPKYAKQRLSAEHQAAILVRLLEVLDGQQHYTQPGFSLRELCDHLDESPHHVSQAINDSHHRNFYDMINRRRVARASSLLKDNPDKAVLDIAFECGFNSKSSFNDVFKRYTGQTPSQHRAAPGIFCLLTDV